MQLKLKMMKMKNDEDKDEDKDEDEYFNKETLKKSAKIFCNIF